MDVGKIKKLVDNLPSDNIYECLYYQNIQIIESEQLSKRKCDSAIISSENNTGIFIKPDIPEEYRQFLLWHEYGHYCLHYDPDMHFNFYLSRFKWKSEQEANTFAVLAILKNEDLESVSVINLLIRKGVPAEIADKVCDSIRVLYC